MKTILEIKNISYSIGDNKILKDINFKCQSGEIIGIIGPNGSGKTTLLKTINGINSINSGDILLNEKSIKVYNEKELARDISFMNQNTNIEFDFPCIDIVVLGRYPYLEKFQEYSKKDMEVAEKYMKLTDTLKFRDKSILQLSGGERQRVLFAKILTQESQVILLDEPTASLDMKYEEDLLKEVSKEKDKDKIIILVIHNLRTAIKYCSRLILLSDGNIVKDGTVEEVITEENLNNVYGIKTKVYYNEISKSLDFCII
ncbi:ABC transporter ATP-binding protein [Fusobacterium simiae]|uniref:ABC transporter ATP-binding protein n=1 Tax=Fusobacterium TaxID=848 RepID=UPI0003F8C1EB|nr:MULTISPECIES: ABC transporter ATP-binding protein [Fusobacterium]MDC7954312.1 ABC transporter ATP-binding protein [Fusobacterium simiae]